MVGVSTAGILSMLEIAKSIQLLASKSCICLPNLVRASRSVGDWQGRGINFGGQNQSGEPNSVRAS